MTNLIESILNLMDIIHCMRLRRFYRGKNIGILIDVGAHKGEYINLMSNIGLEKIYAFEPLKSAYEILREKTKDKSTYIKYFNFALAEKEGNKLFYQNRLSSTSSFLMPVRTSLWMRFKSLILGGKDIIADQYMVETKTLDSVLGDQILSAGVGSKILLKLDVEGFEYNVLCGATGILVNRSIRYIQIENAKYRIYDDQSGCVDELLKKFGYRIVKRVTFPTLSFSDVIYELSERSDSD